MKTQSIYFEDKGPVVRWISTKLLNLLEKLEEPLYRYAEMQEIIFDDEEEDIIDDDQLVIF